MNKSMIAGVDEAGRGPLAGDVVAAAVILPPGCEIKGLTDSKKLTERQRERLFDEICSVASSYSIALASPQEIDHLNILQATLLAMTRAVEGLSLQPAHVLVDGNRLPAWRYSAEAIIKGDSKVLAISAASVLAKVSRDRSMLLLDQEFPEYGFAKHKGYPTKVHRQALIDHGPCPVHRRSYAPVRRCL